MTEIGMALGNPIDGPRFPGKGEWVGEGVVVGGGGMRVFFSFFILTIIIHPSFFVSWVAAPRRDGEAR